MHKYTTDIKSIPHTPPLFFNKKIFDPNFLIIVDHTPSSPGNYTPWWKIKLETKNPPPGGGFFAGDIQTLSNSSAGERKKKKKTEWLKSGAWPEIPPPHCLSLRGPWDKNFNVFPPYGPLRPPRPLTPGALFDPEGQQGKTFNVSKAVHPKTTILANKRNPINSPISMWYIYIYRKRGAPPFFFY